MTTLEILYRAWREKNVFIPANVAWTDIGMATINDEVAPAAPPVKLRRRGWRVNETLRRAKKGSRP